LPGNPPKKSRSRTERVTAPPSAPARDVSSAWPAESRFWALAAALLAALLLLLHGRYLAWPFVSDDFVFLDASRHPGQLFSTFHQYSNYFRPVGRELFFFVGHLLAGNHPLAYHVFNYTVLLGILLLVVALAHRLAGPRVALLAGTAYALLYSHRLALAWVSCSQDLLAALFAMLSVHALLSGRRWSAGISFLVAMLAKESVAALPLVVALWSAIEAPAGSPARGRAAAGLRASAPLWVAAGAWAVIVLAARLAFHAWAKVGDTPLADVTLSVGALWEGLRSALLSYVALEQPWGAIAHVFTSARLPWLALAAALAVILALVLSSRRFALAANPRGAPDRLLALGALWALLGAVPIALAGHHYSAYYITFSGVGFALLAGRLLARVAPALAFAALAVSAVVGEAANRVELFNFERMAPQAGVSFITMTRFEYELGFLDSLHVAMERDPPARGSALYLSHAPHYTTFVTANGCAPRVWYEDGTLQVGMIGDYRPPEARPHAFLRYDPATRGFVSVPNAVMDADLAAEAAMGAHLPAEARVELDRALALLPPTGPVVVRLDLLNNRGFACAALGDTAAARASWLQALAVDPAFASAALNLARLDAPAGRLAEAHATLKHLLEHAPRNVDALHLLARIQEAQGDMESLQETLARLAEVDPEGASQVP
jgi:tetratricopeptide (TPR) repeat protein